MATLIERRKSFDDFLDRCGQKKIGSKNYLVPFGSNRRLALISYPNIEQYIKLLNSDLPVPDQKFNYLHTIRGGAELKFCISFPPISKQISKRLSRLLITFPFALLRIIGDYLQPLKAVFSFKDCPPPAKGYEESAELDVLFVDGMDPWNSEQWVSCEASLHKEREEGLTFKWDPSKKEMQLNTNRTYTFLTRNPKAVLEVIPPQII